MKILFITPFNIFPPFWGGGQRTYHFVKNLAEEHDVVLIMPSFKQFENEKGEEYEEFFRNRMKVFSIGHWIKLPVVEYLNPFMALKCVIEAFSSDVIFCDYPWSGVYALLAHFLAQKPVIFNEHNIEWEVKKQTGAKYVLLMKILEKILCKISKKIVVVSELEAKKLKEYFGVNEKRIVVIENGFDEERFYPRNKEKMKKKLGIDFPMVLFLGKLDYAPNVEAVNLIYTEILPRVLRKRKDVKFFVIGGGRRKMLNMHHPSLIFVGTVKNVEEYVGAADVVIVPLLKGGGTRIKILEALAAGKKVITTSKGCEGLEELKEFLIIEDDWKKFAQRILEEIEKEEKDVVAPIENRCWKKLCEKLKEVVKSVQRNG